MKQFLHILSSLLAAVRQVFLSVLDYFKRLKESRSRYYTRRRDKKRAASGKVHTQNKTTVIKEQPLDIVYPDDLNPDIDKLPAENIVRQFPVSGSPENSTDRRKQFHPKKSARQRITELRHLAGRISRPAFKNIRPAYIIAAIAGVFVLTGLITYASLRSKNAGCFSERRPGDCTGVWNTL